MLNTILPDNFIVTCDVYKCLHTPEYPKDTALLVSTLVPRKLPKYAVDDKITVAGQSYFAEYLETVRITTDLIDEAQEEILGMGYPFDRTPWEQIRDEFDGHPPIAMYGVEEGRLVKIQTPVVAFVATDERFFDLASRIETIAQSCIWKFSTVTTMCRSMRLTLERYLDFCGENPALAEYMLHNFGDRGAADPEEAVRSAIAHALYFSGSDCTNANRYIKKVFRTKKNYLSSVEATEHSVMCSWSDPVAKDDFGAAEMAVDRLEATVARAKAGIGIPVMSVVIDTYDPDRFVNEYLGKRLRERIENSGGKLVARPDSGDPLTEPIKVQGLLAKNFGMTQNWCGYNTLPGYVGVIQGDGINETSLPKICENAVNANWNITNLVFGMGGGLTHRGGRDDCSWSQKATARLDKAGVWHDLLKEPKTDAGKKSLSGLVRCVEGEEGLVVVKCKTFDDYKITGPGWRLWSYNGKRDWIQDFDSAREYARSK